MLTTVYIGACNGSTLQRSPFIAGAVVDLPGMRRLWTSGYFGYPTFDATQQVKYAPKDKRKRQRVGDGDGEGAGSGNGSTSIGVLDTAVEDGAAAVSATVDPAPSCAPDAAAAVVTAPPSLPTSAARGVSSIDDMSVTSGRAGACCVR